ncbi:MAG: insulinase family protein, partial [Armatimonadetes bacterium]|nr:insulinase family protein [Armatimonadota bacterium]
FERMGGEVVAQTDRASTAYRVTVLPEHFPNALALLVRMLTKPALRESDWNVERAVILREKGVAQSDGVKLGMQLMAETAHSAVNSAHGQPIMGSLANVTRFAASDLRTFHAAHYAPTQFTVAVCGAVTADAVAKEVATVLPATTAPMEAVPAPVISAQESLEPRRASLLPANAQTDRALATLTIGFSATPIAADPRRAATCDVLVALLARGNGGMLPTRLRANPTTNALSVEADYLPQADSAMMVIRATGAKQNIGRIEDAVVETLAELAQRLADGGAASLAEELAVAKSAAIADVRYQRETVDGEARYLAFLDTINAPADYADLYAERVRAVTGADILRVLEQEVTPRKRVVSVVGLSAPASVGTKETVVP